MRFTLCTLGRIAVMYLMHYWSLWSLQVLTLSSLLHTCSKCRLPRKSPTQHVSNKSVCYFAFYQCSLSPNVFVCVYSWKCYKSARPSVTSVSLYSDGLLGMWRVLRDIITSYLPRVMFLFSVAVTVSAWIYSGGKRQITWFGFPLGKSFISIVTKTFLRAGLPVFHFV